MRITDMRLRLDCAEQSPGTGVEAPEDGSPALLRGMMFGLLAVLPFWAFVALLLWAAVGR
ncbi:hypothetical protein [Microbacterium sp. E-13]|uniref:hypothetical protein n=1 Tax=Microbacterium sp. E-13 TaxID=3404048 RepID=UPI003CEBA2F2